MKSRKFKLVFIGILAAGGVIAWSPPNSEDVIVGTGNTYSSPSGYLGIIGDGNALNARSFLAVGNSNTVYGANGTNPNLYSAVVGRSNTLEVGGDSNLVSGMGNMVDAKGTLVAGGYNSVGGIGTAQANYSVAIGQLNQITTTYGYAMGYANEVTGQRSVALGSGLEVTAGSATALGRYNAPMNAADVVVVGTGSSETVRNTALRVTSDGGVVLGSPTSGSVVLTRAQGDISMGQYSN